MDNSNLPPREPHIITPNISQYPPANLIIGPEFLTGVPGFLTLKCISI